MQICTPEPPLGLPPSVIEAKNKIRLKHDESCNCCCCCLPDHTCLKYVQPEKPKSYAPLQYYWKSGLSMDDNTTYNLSYWKCPSMTVDSIRPRDNVTTSDGPISDETTYTASYFGNWCFKPEASIIPCEKQFLGRGPMQNVTSQKHDYTWKCTKTEDPYKAQDNLYCSPVALSDYTTYGLSYYNSGCHLPSVSYAPIRKYSKPNIPIDDCTTYKLSYWPNESMLKEDPWYAKREYIPPAERMDTCTTYKLSYWPHAGNKRSPIVLPETDNLLNADCCSDNNTTYRLSYFGCGGDKRDLIQQPGNIQLSPCPLTPDTIYRMSFLGNWCMNQEAPITPCSRQMLGKGPMQDFTTQKHDYTWKHLPTEMSIYPEGNLCFPNVPMESCTTQRLSYIPNDQRCLLPAQTYAPRHSYSLPDVPMKSETIMQLSYQSVDVGDNVPCVWNEKPCYIPPTNPMEDNTTYNTRFIRLLFLILMCMYIIHINVVN